jgi:hypothetical protein
MSVFLKTPYFSFVQLLSRRLWNYGSYATNYLKLIISESLEQQKTKYPTLVWVALY